MKTKILLLSLIAIVVLTACSSVVRMNSSNMDKLVLGMSKNK